MTTLEIFNSLMNEKIENSENILSDYIESDDFEPFLSFFDDIPNENNVITSYSIHYTKLYEIGGAGARGIAW